MNTLRIAIPCCLLLVHFSLLGGWQHESPPTQLSATNTAAPFSEASTNPCAIALSPHQGSGPADREIIRRQRLASRTEQAMVHLERLGWAYVTKARTSLDPGYYTLAEQTALCMESKRPHNAESSLLRAHVLHNLHRFREAEQLARDLVQRRGLWFDYGLLGDVLMEQGRLTEAVDAYQSMMDQRPGPHAYGRAAHIRWLKGDLPGAIDMMRKAAKASGARSPEAGAWAHVRLALYELQAGRHSEASNHIQAALSLQPEYPPALAAQARVLIAEGKIDAAIEPLSHAAESNPLPAYQWALIDVLQAAGRQADARAVEAQLHRHGASTDARTFALYLATTGQQIETALRLAQQELKTRQDIFTFDALAWALHAAGRDQEAYAFSRRALSENTQDARLFYHGAVIAAAAGDHEEATGLLAKAITLERMLLPSERAQLEKECAALKTQPSALASLRAVPCSQRHPLADS